MFSGYRVFVWEDEKVLELDGDAGYKTMSMYLKMVKVVILCIFYQHPFPPKKSTVVKST